MKTKILVSLMALGVFLTSGLSAFSAPYKAAENNPQVVAYYEIGTHGIPFETGGNHEGANLVKQNGKSGNFQAWFYGTYPADGDSLHGHHLVWRISKDGTCPKDAVLIPNASPGWGDYLIEGEDYCVFDNQFKSDK